METLFRLLLARPAVAQDPQNPSIELTQESPYQNAVRNAVQTGAGRAAIEEISRAFVASDRFIPEPSANPLGDRLADLADRLDRLEADRSATSGKVAEAIQAAFDRPAAEVADSEEFLDMRSRLRDSLLAIKILQEEHHRPIEELTRQLRTAEVIGRAATDEHFPQGEEQLRSWRRRSLRLPVEPALKSRLSTREAEEQLRQRRQEAQQQRENEVNGLLASHEQLRIALFELGALGGEHFRVSDRPGGAASPPPETVRLTAEATRASDYLSEARALHLRQLERSVEGGGGPGVNAQAAGLSEGATASAAASLAQTLIPAVSPVLPGRVTFEPPDLADVGFILQVSAADRLSESTRALLAERSLDLASMPLDRLTHTLESDLAGTVSRLEAVAGHPVKQSLLRIGDAMLTIQTPITAGWGTLGTGGLIPLPTFPLDGRVPHTKGDTAPAGVADLLVVKQQLTGYEAADIAHIENVLKGESKTREHSRRQETELVTTSEREVTTSEERELETTDRFEMTRETSQTIKEDLSLKAGLNVSGKYGPTVEFAASAEGSFSRSKEEATKAATTFSQDVTERSSRKIAERVLERTTLRVTTETIEKNTHELNNTTGQGHISGVYQWVNKVYQAQIFNYGLRALFDFMIPEPATFLIAAMSQAHTSALSLTKPPDFPLTPSQINESNYSYWVKQCGATDVAPPPELYRTKSMDFKAGGGDKNTNYNHSGQITIDDGYRALFGSVGFVRNVWESDHSLDVTLGRRTQRMGDGNWLWTTTLDDERDSIPVALDFLHCSQVAVAVEVKCQRTDRAMEKWRLETHAKLTTAHQALVADYESKLAALQLQAGVAIRGRNPAANLASIRDELKKDCISILTDQHYDLFDAIEDSPANGLPQEDLFEAAGEGPYVRFFEQAFEWEHMSWVTYPYFWGRKDQWDERLGYDDPDPVFADFLRAGYCRVSVPVRPGFEGAIDHFLTFGETWNGGPLPAISSPLFLPIGDEIAERLDRPGDEIPQGDPWTVRVPTNLVHLRPDDSLPRWEKNAAGEWVEV